MALHPPAAHTPLLSAGTTTGSTSAVQAPGAYRTFQASAVASTGTGNAVVAIEGSILNNGYWDTIGTITLTSASTAGMSDGFTSADRYSYVRANVTSLSSNITVEAYMGY